MTRRQLLILAVCAFAGMATARTLPTPVAAAPSLGKQEAVVSRPSKRVHLPIIIGNAGDACAPIPGASYAPLSVNPPPSDRPAAAHGDLNLALRSFTPTGGHLGLVDYGGGSDSRAPQLAVLFADRRTAVFRSLARVYDWNWACNCRGALIASPEATLAHLATTAGETIHLPSSGYAIGSGYQALVLYATAERLTLKYTRDDNVVQGYTLHLEGLCVEPSLLALYQSLNAAGRASLPALRGGQALGRAGDSSVGVAIRDTGRFLDPRSRKDWWQGR
jgi:hypothetical protein